MKARKIARQIIQRVIEENAYSNILLNTELNKSELEQNDKALVTEIVYGTLRRKRTLDMIIGNFVKDIKVMNKSTLNILRVAIYQMQFLDKIPEYAAVNEAVEEAKEISEDDAKLVNGILRSYQKNGDDIEIQGNRIEEYSYKFSFEPWMIRFFISQYGEDEAKRIMAGLNQVPSTTVRINETKSSYDDIFEELEEAGYDVEDGYVCPEAIIIRGGSSIEKNPLFIDGKITVQDESAMLVSSLLEVKEDEKVLDLCAAPGGKSTHIGELLNNTGEVLAFDLQENKLGLIQENVDRLGLTNIKIEAMDASRLNSKYVGYADKVLIDVPCSGLGIIRKKPEIKWNKSRKELREIVEIQREIMKNAWEYLKPGGVMVYSTCTLNKEENEENIKWFKEKNRDAKIEKIFVGNNRNLKYNKDGTLTIFPNEYMDGFFIAKFKKL